MTTTNKIGLNVEKSKKLADQLNDLLANYSVFYQNSRAFQWNIKGDKFFELHEKFEELYNDLFIKIDEIAERILTLGYTPEHNFSSYLKASEIKESQDTSEGIKDVQHIVDSYAVLIRKQRAILDASDDLGDEGTNALMSDYIREQEKQLWMYNAYLNN